MPFQQGRDFSINGESLVQTKFGAHLDASISNIPSSVTNLSNLGLAEGPIQISPRFFHRDVHADDFGIDAPAEVHWRLADVNIRMTLVHYDPTILDYCTSESMGGTIPLNGGGWNYAGIFDPCGKPMGGNGVYLASGYHYISLTVLSPIEAFPWHFPAAYLAERPFILPLGTEASKVELNWRAIGWPGHPYGPTALPPASGGVGELISSGITLWDHTLDT